MAIFLFFAFNLFSVALALQAVLTCLLNTSKFYDTAKALSVQVLKNLSKSAIGRHEKGCIPRKSSKSEPNSRRQALQERSLSTQDNIFYASGFSSVMDGWHLVEPIAAIFIPTDSALPVVLILPEASIISLIVSERGGHPVHFERIATFDMLNFC